MLDADDDSDDNADVYDEFAEMGADSDEESTSGGIIIADTIAPAGAPLLPEGAPEAYGDGTYVRI